MNDELTQKLYANFPYLYRGHTKSKEVSSMCWGFECGDGWFQVLWELSTALTDYLKLNPELEFEVMQVKSKLGSLRYYVDGGDKNTRELIDKAILLAQNVTEDI